MSKKKSSLVSVVLLLFAFGVFGQVSDFQREVAYGTSTVKTFKVACDVDIDSLLSGIDWVYLQAKPAFIRQTKFVIAANRLTITNIYPQKPRYERDYEFQMGKSVTNAWGTRLYTHEDEEYYNLENETENEGFLLDAATIGSYGVFNGLFNSSLAEIEAYCDSAGIPFYSWGQKLLIVQENENEGENERTEIETDFEQLYFETRLFRGDNHVLTDRTEYQRTADDWIVPAKKKHVYYSELPSETRYQITEIETYLYYQIIDQSGDTLVNTANNANPNFAIFLTPDPARDSLFVHFSTPINDDVGIAIKNIANTAVLAGDFTVVGSELLIDISQLESGMYTVFCTYNNETAEADFLKMGIGQYSNQNPAVLAIQILPNPATHTVEVVFPLPINAAMNVKITDVMGTVHLNTNKHVSGNTLSLDIQHFPQDDRFGQQEWKKILTGSSNI